MRNILLATILSLFSIMFSGCIIFSNNNDYDVYIARFRNSSSTDIYLQYYMQDHNNLKADYSFAYGLIIPAHTTAIYSAPLDNDYLEKIVIVDSNNRKLLRKISGTIYYSMLSKLEIVTENNYDGGKNTIYNYYFTVTDDFLENN